MVTKKYKGVHFGTLKSQRTDFKGTCNKLLIHVVINIVIEKLLCY